MRYFEALLLGLLLMMSNDASAEVCVKPQVVCVFDEAFAMTFDGLDIERPHLGFVPELYRDGDRPVIRHVVQWGVSESDYKVLLHDSVRFSALLTAFSGEMAARLCSSENIAGFVSAGGIVEIWIGLHPKWENPEFVPTWTKEKIMIRVDTCEAR